jgi:hypothetical protein
MTLAQNLCLACLLAASAGGCVTYRSGERIDPTLVAQIHRDVTTRPQVEALFGPPMRVDIINIGQRMLRYSYREVFNRGRGLLNPNPGTQTRDQLLLVWVGPDNIVKDFEFTDYLTDRSIQGSATVVKRTAIATQASAGNPGGG